MVSLASNRRMTFDSLDAPSAEEWHTADASESDLLQQLELQVGVSEADRATFGDVSAFCGSVVASRNDASDVISAWQAQQLAEVQDDAVYDQTALNHLLDMPVLLNVNHAQLPFNLLSAHYSTWCEFAPTERCETPRQDSDIPPSATTSAKVPRCGIVPSSLPNIESLMNVGSNSANLPSVEVVHSESLNVSNSQELFNGTSYLSTQQQQEIVLSPTPPVNSNQNKKSTSRKTTARAEDVTRSVAKRRKRESGTVKTEFDEESHSQPDSSRKHSADSPSESSASISTVDDDSMDDRASACDSSSIPNGGTAEGPLHLTEEERSLLEKEGLRLPLIAPLTKEQERILKRVRRKIRNKISAKNSRLKKQEYVGGLEQRVLSSSNESVVLQRRVQQLEKENETLVNEVTHLRNLLLAQQRAGPSSTTAIGMAPSAMHSGGKLPPIDTLTPAPKGKLLLIVAFSFAITFLPVFGVQLRRPALLQSRGTGSPFIFGTSPFDGASRILLAIHADVDLADVGEHRHVVTTWPHVPVEGYKFRRKKLDLAKENISDDMGEQEDESQANDENEEILSDDNVPEITDNYEDSHMDTSDDATAPAAVDELSDEGDIDYSEQAEFAGQAADAADTGVTFNFTTTFVEFLQHKRSEF